MNLPQEQRHGYILVGDNLDRNIRPRHQTIQSQTHSVHWFNTIAVKDRCNFSAFADTIPVPDVSPFDVKSFLPDGNDCKQLIDVEIIVGRLLVKHVSGFSKFSGLIQSHINHSYSSEM